ncbi:hypothetical protein QVD99_003192 [Batrachochytrium dendrobatidis]|nr:hypothetical protein O5D80_001645 [Batrachochytrium dendrobatidis]KAK5670512.1 hypothetical protein QVD99_003192 [Batrachochytrium dendrobatidis]
MKLSTAVLSSILLTCSVTTAKPAPPITTISTVPKISTGHSARDAGLAGINSLSTRDRSVIKTFVAKKEYHKKASKLHGLVQSVYNAQANLLIGLGEDPKRFQSRSWEISANPNHELSEQYFILSKLKEQSSKSNYYYRLSSSAVNQERNNLVNHFFGGASNSKLVNSRMTLLESNPTILNCIREFEKEFASRPPQQSSQYSGARRQGYQYPGSRQQGYQYPGARRQGYQYPGSRQQSYQYPGTWRQGYQYPGAWRQSYQYPGARR